MSFPQINSLNLTDSQANQTVRPVTDQNQGLQKATDCSGRSVTDVTEGEKRTVQGETSYGPDNANGNLMNRRTSSLSEKPSTSEITVRHTVCLNQENAPKGYNRVGVPADKINWDESFENYKPTEFTAAKILEQPSYADPVNPEQVDWSDKFHRSHTGEVKFNANRMPLNPMGRTGTEGRGELGKWGPNHAADPIITRYNREGKLELLLIQRRDNQQWALPGGMVDPDDSNFSTTALRELAEEALNSEAALDDDIKRQLDELKNTLKERNTPEGDISKEVASKRASLVYEKIKQLPELRSAEEVYKGYVDDRRNTDNAWMETAAYHVHVNENNPYLNNPVAGDDAQGAQWTEVTPKVIDELYASHSSIVKQVKLIRTAVGESQ